MPPANARPSQASVAGATRLTPVSADSAPLFVYGSLLFPEVVRILIGRGPGPTAGGRHGP